ncbi:tetratricopeptide repeat protein [Sphingopyxis sp.]|uniref:tetratricopeptide repeat protein n=1 Tax=Sphingopyxis sp. TaxID=1908224 RepID=UPI003F726B12
MMRRVVAAIALFCCCAAQPAAARWLRADTNNFIIYSEGDEKSLRRFAENLQLFDATLRHRFNVPGGFEPNRLTIYLVPRAADVNRLSGGRLGPATAGFYSVTTDGSFAVSNRENDSNSGRGTPASQQILFHEYSHHFMKRYMPVAFPAWFIEGFAEYLSTVDFNKEGRPSVGMPVYSRAYGLIELPKIPAERLLFERPTAMKDSAQQDAYYGRAWLLTHMLYSDPKRAGQLLAYMQAINRGDDPAKAAPVAFGDLATLDKDLNAYLNRRLSYTLFHKAMVVEGEISIAPLSAAEDALLPLRLERLSSGGDHERLAAIAAKLQKLAAVHPGDAGIWYELAAAEWDKGDEHRSLPTTRAAVDKALALKTDHVRANVLLGRLLAAEMDAKGDYSDAAWRAVRKPIALANRTNPDDPLPLFEFFQSYVNQGQRPPAIALQGLAQAFSLEPENVTIRMNHAFALANKGDFDGATNLAKTIAFDPHDRGSGQNLLDQIEAMRGRGKDGGASDADVEAAAED